RGHMAALRRGDRAHDGPALGARAGQRARPERGALLGPGGAGGSRSRRVSPAVLSERRGRERRGSAGAHRAAGRVVDILELVITTRDGLALRELSARLEAPKSSLLPLLRTLTARGYLEQGPLGEYRLGPRALELGLGRPGHRGLPEIARPALRALM